MSYKIFRLSEDGLLKRVEDRWDRYDSPFDEYETMEQAQQAIQDARENGRTQITEFVILPVFYCNE